MTEKQRWLVKELEQWRSEQLGKIGRYGPRGRRHETPKLRAARAALRRAEQVVADLEKARDDPWRKAQDGIGKKAADVRRIIVFEPTEKALKAVKELTA